MDTTLVKAIERTELIKTLNIVPATQHPPTTKTVSTSNIVDSIVKPTEPGFKPLKPVSPLIDGKNFMSTPYIRLLLLAELNQFPVYTFPQLKIITT